MSANSSKVDVQARARVCVCVKEESDERLFSACQA